MSITAKDSIVDLERQPDGSGCCERVDQNHQNPGVTITDDQSGKSFDGDNTVAYTLTFTEGVQKIDADDLTVTGATVDTVVHTAGSNTATVNVIVTDGSMANVSITAKKSIVDLAGNPMVQAVVNDSQTVDTKNPGVTITDDQSAIKSFDGDNTVAYLTFSEAMDTGKIDATDLTVSGPTVTNQSGEWVRWQDDSNVIVTDDSMMPMVSIIEVTAIDDLVATFMVYRLLWSDSRLYPESDCVLRF